ncbi:hypothetical protein DSCW_08080 [Desulfosarcina widdelii]|uniref:Lipoprotein n=2 Tax=Desulfosarcina widdelii TaxID=947919 RepID=A0A5K7Z1L9_9BACT|nr:hypothetical protein DSCW_08080 [Desulfosarcina widdelii]
MRIGAIFILTAFLLTGCVHMKINQNVNALERIQKGDSQEAVLETMGPPDLRKDIGNNRSIVYYQTRAGAFNKDAAVTTDLCTPIAFEDGVVVSVGEDLADVWIQEEAAHLRQMEAEERRRREAEMKAASRQKVEQERLDKIADLEKKVKPVPASNAALNLKLYRQLLSLDPDNTRYQKKVAFYEARLVQQKKAREALAARNLEKKHRQAWEQSRDQRNKTLRRYTGNGIAEMAVHDMGPGSMYVWVKNVSRQVITTHPDHFILLDNQGNRVECTISSSLDSVLQPGAISHGKIEYNESVYPGELIFRNREAGRVGKSFQ